MQQSQTNTTRFRCRQLRRQGDSIGDIARKLSLSESTVHWHVKDIVLTRTQRKKIHERWCAVMAQVNGLRRGRPLKPVSFKKPEWSSRLVRLIAHLGFDGRIDRYGCYYYNRSHSQALHVKRLLSELLGIVPRIRIRSNGIWVVSFHNVEVAAWLLQKEEQLLEVVTSRTHWRPQWLQALFDDEGHVHIANGKRRVRASQDDENVLEHARDFLETLGIRSRIDKSASAIEVTGRDNLLTFQNKINFSPGIRINAHRKNGLWRRELEKRELLDIALSSYKTASLFHNSGR